MRRLPYYICIGLMLLTVSCTVSTPADYTDSPEPVSIYPEYTGVTVPLNIAPLRFTIENEGEEFITQLRSGNQEYCYAGPDVCPSQKQWKKLTAASQDIEVTIYAKRHDKWLRMKAFHLYVSEDRIDPYIAYRLIAPSYVDYEELTINQRCLENYDEKVIYGTMSNSTEKDGQCINCHSFQQYNPDRMQFHVRQGLGGTVVTYDGKTQKVNLKTDNTISAGVYPSWHPTEKLIAYSTNTTSQTFHTRDLQKVEVQDTYGDLILYDVENNKVIPLPQDTCDMDCFPWWSPDGKYLYYCSAHYEQKDSSISRQMDLIRNFQDVHYNLYRRAFHLADKSVGERELVYDAAAEGKSATLPRISPDGEWLLFTKGNFGVFHIWHTDADLYLMNLASKEVRPMDELNSPQVDSYHSWSSNGRWIVFSSRRDDGNYTRPFIAHFGKDGKAAKPFELPSKYPQYHRELLRSYNIPEFVSGPMKVTPQEFAKAIRKNAVQATE
ncbi:MAG: PD40 domain-containing protein [Bacteroidaceae bacterium]|nr:PD40 domain-containing protein [Bacteroidaceae bacterium]